LGDPLNITETQEDLELKVLEKTEEIVLKIRKWEIEGGIPPLSFLC